MMGSFFPPWPVNPDGAIPTWVSARPYNNGNPGRPAVPAPPLPPPALPPVAFPPASIGPERKGM